MTDSFWCRCGRGFVSQQALRNHQDRMAEFEEKKAIKDDDTE